MHVRQRPPSVESRDEFGTTAGTSAQTSAESTNPTSAGVELDVSAGGPYEGTTGASLLLTADLAVKGQSDTISDLEAIGTALLAYRDEHGAYPPAFLTDADGNPTVSWRVLLLPFLGEAELYERFDLTASWDDPANEDLIEEIPAVYAADVPDTALTEGVGNTAYAGVSGLKHVFRDGAASLDGGMAPGSVTDGDTMTIAVGPVGASVMIPWTSPGDVDTNEHPTLGDPSGFDGPGSFVTPLLFLDGSIHTYPDDLDEGTVLSWSTVAGDACSPPASLALRLVSGWDFDGDGEADAYGSSVEFPTDETGRARGVADGRGRDSAACMW